MSWFYHISTISCFSCYFSPVLDPLLKLPEKSHSSVKMCWRHIWVEQNNGSVKSLKSGVFSLMFRSIDVEEQENWLCTPIPLHFPSRENVGMSFCCILTCNTSVFNTWQIPKMFAQRILLFPVHFSWCLLGGKKTPTSGLKFGIKSQMALDVSFSLDPKDTLSSALEYVCIQRIKLLEKNSPSWKRGLSGWIRNCQ